MNYDRIFALDIGTRKVLGLVMEKEEDAFRVVTSRMIEHTSRVMFDGQIHDVEAVSEVIKKIKDSVEEELGVEIEKAAVAAAGRALKTRKGKAQQKWDRLSEISAEEVRTLELEAVQEAQMSLAQEESSNNNMQYLCVGYSIVKYRLEDQEIESLVGQMATSAQVEIIATFLPRVVVDSLFSALKRADLELSSLTLEPIAALTVAIPKNMRLLNLVLLDIGAGTSDIALIKDGNIYAYAMVPLGGDEVSEELARQYLLDFDTAEQIKCQLSSQQKVFCEDILGNENELESEELIAALKPLLKNIAHEIVNQILSINDKTPDAVICVGGGSLTPRLIDFLAEALELPTNRIGIKSKIKQDIIKCPAEYLQGPQGITALGIAFESFKNKSIPLLRLMVNEREVILWKIGNENISRALLNAGVDLSKIQGKPGLGKTVEINGYIKVFKGEMGSAPLIKLNGEWADLNTPVKDNDYIEFSPGKDGSNAVIQFDDLCPGGSGIVYVNNEQISLRPYVTVNGREFSEKMLFPDRAKVEVKRSNQIKAVLLKAGVDQDFLEETVYNYYLNEQPMVIKWLPIHIRVDGKEKDINSSIDFGSCLDYRVKNKKPTIKDLVINELTALEINIEVNQKKFKLKGKGPKILKSGREVTPDEEIDNGDRLIINRESSNFILSDIFQVIDVEYKPGDRLLIKVNEEEAGFATPIFEGSKIEIKWEEK